MPLNFCGYLRNDQVVLRVSPRALDRAARAIDKCYKKNKYRTWRVANRHHSVGRKYDKDYELKERGTGDPDKAESARIFYKYWKKAEAEKRYAAQKKSWKGNYG